ncbi:tyrosine-type recombinase/integrase [Campylobacter sp. MOP51]|uniref:tyrosine-type recombinase/integrase n=1 Tax=Campylobacter canis TaxID=3378588 RepID=UPI003C52066E
MELLDTSRDIAETTLEDVLDIADILKALPKRNIQKYRDMPISQILESEIPEADTISIKTATKQIKWVKSFYTYCNSKGWIGGAIAQQVSIASDTNALDERLPLELDEVLKLIDLLTDNKPIQNLVKILYTSGMRLSEVYKCEIKEIDGIGVYDLTARDIKLKTKSSYRVIPVHGCVDTGLIKELSYSQQASKIINKLIREHISDDSRKVLYSLRHSFATILKYKGIQQEVIAELMGHTHGGMTFGRYAGRYPVATLKEAIDTIEFP